jgi:hypothetical protein
MNEYFYIVHKKLSNRRKHYICDGLWYAESKEIAQKEIAFARGFPADLIKLTFRKKITPRTD